MRKIFIVVFVLAVSLSLIACGAPAAEVEEVAKATEAPTEAPTEEPTEAPTEAPALSPLDAVTEGEAYTNDYFGLTLNVPAGYVWYTDEELAATFGIDATAIDVSDLSSVTLLPLGMCYDPAGTADQMANMNFSFSNSPTPQNDDEALAALETTAALVDSMLGTQTIYADPTPANYGGHIAYIFDTESYLEDELMMYQAMVLIEVEEGTLTFTYTYHSPDQIGLLVDSVDSITFSK